MPPPSLRGSSLLAPAAPPSTSPSAENGVRPQRWVWKREFPELAHSTSSPVSLYYATMSIPLIICNVVCNARKKKKKKEMHQ